MKKEIRDILRETSMISPASPYYVRGIANIQKTVQKFINKPSFTDKLK